MSAYKHREVKVQDNIAVGQIIAGGNQVEEKKYVFNDLECPYTERFIH